jgi:hypothetical protein
MEQEADRTRHWAYLLVALAGLLAGMALGQLGAERDLGHPRIEWPAPAVPHPRSIQP